MWGSSCAFGWQILGVRCNFKILDCIPQHHLPSSISTSSHNHDSGGATSSRSPLAAGVPDVGIYWGHWRLDAAVGHSNLGLKASCFSSHNVSCMISMATYLGPGRRVVPSHPGRAPAALPVVVEPRAATHVLGVLLGLGVPILGGILGLVARLRRQKNQPPQLPAAPKHPQLSASRVPQQLHGAPEQRNVVMFGQTGSGKSTSGNHLVEKGKEVFKVSDGMSSETKGFEVADSKHYCYCEQDRVSLPYELQVYDTQGFSAVLGAP